MGEIPNKQFLNYTEILYKSNAAVKCVNERGTIMTSVTKAASQLSVFHQHGKITDACGWLLRKNKKSVWEKRSLELSFHKYTLGKRTKAPSERLSFLLPRVRRKAL